MTKSQRHHQLNLKLDAVEHERIAVVAAHLGISKESATRQLMK